MQTRAPLLKTRNIENKRRFEFYRRTLKGITMSFRDNLQHLRATRNMTQEQLAMLLGVSRQSVTKWEAEKSYPEMDKLIKICQLFECSLDDLVQGDLTSRQPQAEKAIPVGGTNGCVWLRYAPTNACLENSYRNRSYSYFCWHRNAPGGNCYSFGLEW